MQLWAKQWCNIRNKKYWNDFKKYSTFLNNNIILIKV